MAPSPHPQRTERNGTAAKERWGLGLTYSTSAEKDFRAKSSTPTQSKKNRNESSRARPNMVELLCLSVWHCPVYRPGQLLPSGARTRDRVCGYHHTTTLPAASSSRAGAD